MEFFIKKTLTEMHNAYITILNKKKTKVYMFLYELS
jgi:hypothetical protein